VLVVSDHGFRLEDPGDGNPRYYGHGLAPAGIFIGAGPAFEHREVEGLSVYDMLPLMAYLKGFPVADDLQGRLRRDIVSPAFRAAQPLRRVASYGGRSAEGVAAPLGVEPEMIERLRALGYIQ
jgi:hypothetical protein